MRCPSLRLLSLILVAALLLTACGATLEPSEQLFQGTLVPTRTGPTDTEGITAIFPLTEGGLLRFGTPQAGAIDDESYAIRYTFDGRAGQTIDISMDETSGDIDTFLLLLAPDGREIARNDDRSSGYTSAQLNQINLPQDGTYSVIATRYRQRYGTDTGNFTLLLEENDGIGDATELTQLMRLNSTQIAEINDENLDYRYAFEAQAGDVINVLLTRLDGDLDPSLILTDSVGNELYVNDDISAVDNRNAGIFQIMLPQSGWYTIVATLYSQGESTGRYELELEQSDTGGADDIGYEFFAYLDSANSKTLRDVEQSLIPSGYYVGDDYRAELDAEVRVQTILTYYLPPLDEVVIDEAYLELENCEDENLGLAAVEGFTIFVESLGQVTGQTPFEPSIDARQLGGDAVFEECRDINLTNEVQDAYEADPNTPLQIRIMPVATVENGQDDSVVFNDPRLIIELER